MVRFVNELYSRARKLLVVGAKNKIESPLKKTQRRVIVNQNMTTIDQKVERNQIISKIKKKQSEEDIIKGMKDKIIRAIENFFQRGEDYCYNK